MNPCDYAFLSWMGELPESGHRLDLHRFHVFAKAVARYRSKKWRDHTYFRKRILGHTPHFDESNIDHFYFKLLELIDFYDVAPIASRRLEPDSDSGLYQVGVMNGKRYRVKISEAEYLSRKGATKETLSKATYF
jgi:hypothetical protein